LFCFLPDDGNFIPTFELSILQVPLRAVVQSMDWFGLVVTIGIFLVMAGFSCTIESNKFLEYLKRPKAVLIGVVCQYIAMPLSAFFISQMLDYSALHSIAFIMTGSCPGGTLSNFWCWFFGADLELSIAMTACSSLLSIVFLTINCLIYMPLVSDAAIEVDYASLAISVSSLILGVITGLLIGYKTKIKPPSSPWIKCRVKPVMIHLAAVAMLLTVFLGIYENTILSPVPAYELPMMIFIGCIMLNGASWIFTVFLSFCVFRLAPNQTMTVSIECANQNVGLSIAILLLTLTDQADEAVGVPMFMGTLNAVIILIFGTLFRVSGFIEDNDDEMSTKYADSGFTKIGQCLRCNKRKGSEKVVCHDDLEAPATTRLSHHRHVPSTSEVLMDDYECNGMSESDEVQLSLKRSVSDDLGERVDD